MKNETEIKERAIVIYGKANEAGKKQLEEIFGKDFFPKDIGIESLQDYEDACKYLNVDPQKNLPYQDPKTTEDRISNLQRMYNTYCKAINKMDGDFEPDFSNPKQKKYWHWVVWDSKASGFVFSVSFYACWTTSSLVGARLCVFRSAKTAEFACRQMLPIITKMLTL